jgi:hypothetical protein
VQYSKKSRFLFERGLVGKSEITAVNRLICWATRAAAIGALALFVSSAIATAQEPPADTPPAPADDSMAPAAPNGADTPQAAPAPSSTDPSGCKGLEEKPCRKNKVCTWIIPKDPDKAGNVKPPYCRKLGRTKKKKTTGDASPESAAQPPAPAQEQAPPAEPQAEQAAPAAPPPEQMPDDQSPPGMPGQMPN